MDALRTRIKHVLVRSLHWDDMTPDEIGDDTPLFGSDGLGLDSVDALELAVSLEQEFRVMMQEEGVDDRQTFATVNALADYIHARQ
jgi:acyl carrier protein